MIPADRSAQKELVKTVPDRNEVIRAFRNYTAAYNPEDPKIRLKINHSYRVAGLCSQIAGEAKTDPELSWLCGMLHDIGRFEQVRRYNTFSDANSVDHASLSCELLFRDGLITSFAPDLDPEPSRILETAIGCHSLYRLPADLTEEETAYCNVLRDADKIDIFRVNCDTPPEEIYNVTSYDLAHSEVSPAVKNCFLQKTAVRRDLRKTAIDYLVGHICLRFELVYPISREIAREQGYIDQMLAFRSANPETEAWFAYMRGNIWRESSEEN